MPTKFTLKKSTPAVVMLNLAEVHTSGGALQQLCIHLCLESNLPQLALHQHSKTSVVVLMEYMRCSTDEGGENAIIVSRVGGRLCS